MTDSRRSDQIEFIRLGGHNVRVTSWTVDEQPGAFTLVTITRGTRDAELLTELLGQDRVELEIPGQQSIQVHAVDIDRHDAGEGQSAICRFAVKLAPGDQTAVPAAVPLKRSLENRVAELESEIAELRAILGGLVNDQ